MRHLFEWDARKGAINYEKHHVSFSTAREAFYDPKRILMVDSKHSAKEERYFCYGMVNGDVLTVRFAYRGKIIRIIGAAYWREGKQLYAKKNRL